MTKLGLPTEDDEQRRLVAWLRIKGICFCSVPNEGARSFANANRLRALGLSSGVPDILIFSKAPRALDLRGVAIELKRTHKSKVTENQRFWADKLVECGWLSLICHGADSAIRELQLLGY